jgi:hypothetical protein
MTQHITQEQAFEQWYVENAFNFEVNPIGSRDCGLQRKAWHAAIQWDRDQSKAELPVLPSPVAQFNWVAGKFEWLQPYQHGWHNRQPLIRQIDARAYGAACAAHARELALEEAAQCMEEQDTQAPKYNAKAIRLLKAGK